MRHRTVVAGFAWAGIFFAGSASGVEIPADGTVCSLADAIRSANLNVTFGGCVAGDDAGGFDTILLGYDVILGFLEPASTEIGGARAALPDVVSNVVLSGAGHLIRRDPALICHPANEGSDFRLLQVLSGGALTVTFATLSHGCVIDPTLAEGGAVLVSGSSFAAQYVTFTDNQARGTNGNSDGSVTAGAARGGALFADGASTINLSASNSFVTNSARGGDDSFGHGDAGSAFGGAIFVESTADFTASSLYFQSNSAQGGSASGPHAGGDAEGGAVHGTLASLEFASFRINYALGGTTTAGESGSAFGGAFYGGIGALDQVWMFSNFAYSGYSETGTAGLAGGGGAVMIPGPEGTPSLANAWFEANAAFSYGLATGGGAIVTDSGVPMSVSRSAFIGNRATGFPAQGAGLCVGCLSGPAPVVTLANVTVHGNVAYGNLVGGVGGGIFSSGNLTLGSTTVSGNQANVEGGGIYAFGTLTLGNSILADNLINGFGSAADCTFDGGTYTSAGYNWLESAAPSCPGSGPGDHAGDPGLGTYGAHGAASIIPTISLTATSPAIDQGSCSAAIPITTDGRGFARPQNLAPANALDGCDPGAYELFNHDLDLAVADSIDPVTAPSTELVYTVTATNTGFSGLSGIATSVTFGEYPWLVLGSPVASTGSASCGATSCNWTGLALATGASATLQLPFTVLLNAPDWTITCNASLTAVDQSLPSGLPTAQQVTSIRAHAIFSDGFESGTSSAWSNTSP